MSASQVFAFPTSHAQSEIDAKAEWWDTVYRNFFGSSRVLAIVPNEVDGWGQRGGIDKTIHLLGSKTVLIDEKVDEYPPVNFFLEIWSDFYGRKEGWLTKPLATDYIAYAFKHYGKCYFLPLQALQHTWRINEAEWRERYKIREVKNEGGYMSQGICVPVREVLIAIARAAVVRWEA